jgi:hypothetical protein
MPLFFAILCLIASAECADSASSPLPVERNGKFGYIDRSGGEIIPAQFDSAKWFSGGLAAVQLNGKWGYINTTGAMVIQPHFERATNFSEGRALVAVQQAGNLKYSYIDTGGQPISDETYDQGESFSEGFAAVEKSGHWFFINATGKRVFDQTARFENASSFRNGFAPISVQGLYGYIDTSGNLIVPPQFKMAEPFNEGMAPVQSADGKWGYIDQHGTMTIKPQFETAMYFSGGLAAVRKTGRDRKRGFGFIDKSGSFVIKPRFIDARPFTDGLALVAVQDQYDPPPTGAGGEAADPTRWGFINPRGEFAILPHFLIAAPFRDGAAYVVTAVTVRAYYIDIKEALIGFQSDKPVPIASAGFVNDYVWVGLSLESTPAGATVYAIPLFEWENDTNLPNEPEKLWVYQVTDRPGVTPLITKVPRETYVFIFKLNGKIQRAQKVIHEGDNPVVSVRFQ